MAENKELDYFPQSGFFELPEEDKKEKPAIKIEDNLYDFLQAEEKEAGKLLKGKEDWHKYYHHSIRLFKDYFIPHTGNSHRPKVLRPKQLTIMAIALIMAKVVLVGYIFVVYQQKAEMSETTISQILALTNESRLANGVSALTLNPILSEAAQNKAEDMVINNYFSHTSPDGRKPWNFVNRNAYPYTLIGENLAMNFIAAADAHTALMASPSHQKNILNPKYSDLGLAVVNGQIDGENTNILVEIFGARTTTIVKKEEIMPLIIEAGDKPMRIETPILEPEVITSTTPVVVKSDIDVGLTTSTPTTTEIVASITPLLIEKEVIANSPPLPEQVVYSSVSVDKELSRATKMMYLSKVIYLVVVAILILLLLINILVRITIQHRSIIVQTILLIILILALVFFDLDFMKEARNAAVNLIIL